MRILFALALLTASLGAESGREAWLRYQPLPEPLASRYRDALPNTVRVVGEEPELSSANKELSAATRAMLGDVPPPRPKGTYLVGTLDALAKQFPGMPLGPALGPDSFRLKTLTWKGSRYLVIAGGNPRGALTGTFALSRRIGLREPVDALDVTETPYAPIRWVNHWDNLDGSIERGYGGPSIFFENGGVRADLARAAEYARLLASLGIQACSVNNVNANPRTMDPDFLPGLARIAAAFRPWGVKLALSVDFGSPQKVGKLETFDPLDPRVAAWWKAKVDEIYKAVPDMAGFVLKADSEGRVGPAAYKRTHADAANVIARALKPHGGLLFYRGFVYDHHMDWRNLKNDRARAAWDNFQPLDGRFDANVVIQIKHGPIDFQVREPASPLFGTLEKTNQAIELQITQEYFGQARHTVYLAPMWKEALDFDLHARGAGTPVKALVSAKVFPGLTGGIVGVSNVGMDENWLGNHMSQANLYAFGRLAWDPDLTSERIIDEWTRLTLGHEQSVVETVSRLQLASWRMYENYTGPLGLQTLTEITGTHYGPAVEASERNGWGQWHRADEQGVGMDRTVETGTGFLGQYREPVRRLYTDLKTCPDELLVFMHHVPYTHRLRSGKTVIQHIYDSHYEGTAEAEANVDTWRTLSGLVDEQRYREVLAQLEYQAGSAQVWRDSVNAWFRKISGIEDEKGRVGNFPGRQEAESMTLEGFVAVDAVPWETASGAKAVHCPAERCTASFRYKGPAGEFMLSVRYFDRIDGVSKFRLLVAGRALVEWSADDRLPSRKIDGASSTRRLIPGVSLQPGDEIRIEATPDGAERAPLDYVEIIPAATAAASTPPVRPSYLLNPAVAGAPEVAEMKVESSNSGNAVTAGKPQVKPPSAVHGDVRTSGSQDVTNAAGAAVVQDKKSGKWAVTVSGDKTKVQ